VAVTILHVSDLHVGAHEGPDVEASLAELVARIRPELIVASGDLTHRGRRSQHEQAAALLRGLGAPVVAVPGNHDIPYTFPARFTKPLGRVRAAVGDDPPVHVSDGVCLVEINSVRPGATSRAAYGTSSSVGAGQLAPRGGRAPPVAMHHQMIGAPWRTRKRPVCAAQPRAQRARRCRRGAGRLPVTHQGAVAERHEFEVWSKGQPGAAVATTPGLGQPRPHRRGEARGLLVYEADERSLAVHTYIWRDGDWSLTATRRFPRGSGSL
jgi:hypothetical protein